MMLFFCRAIDIAAIADDIITRHADMSPASLRRLPASLMLPCHADYAAMPLMPAFSPAADRFASLRRFCYTYADAAMPLLILLLHIAFFHCFLSIRYALLRH